MKWFVGIIVVLLMIAGAIDEPTLSMVLLLLIFVLPQAVFYWVKGRNEEHPVAGYTAAFITLVVGVTVSALIGPGMLNSQSSGLLMMMTSLALAYGCLALIRFYSDL